MPSITPHTGALGPKLAKHLLNRTTFGATHQQIKDFAELTPQQAVAELLLPLTPPTPPLDPLTGDSWVNPAPTELNSGGEELVSFFTAWDLEQKRKSIPNLTEKMTWFLHSHLPIAYSVVTNPAAFYYQNVLFRYFALGNYKALFTKLTFDNGMLTYIDNYLNDYASPNENYAREMLELYSIGKGPQIGADDYTNYTEQDVKAAAKVISGYTTDYTYTTIDADTQIPRGKVVLNGTKQAYKHDPGSKQFSAKFQNTIITPNEVVSGYATEDAVYDELDQLMEMIFRQDETARFLVRKMYRFFAYAEITPEIESDVIEPLAATFRQNNYEMAPVLKQLLESVHFYDLDTDPTSDNIRGALIKSPVEVILSLYRYFEISFPDLNDTNTVTLNDLYRTIYANNLIRALEEQGIPIYNPYDVAGYDPYYQFPGFHRLWITPNNLANRYYFSKYLISGFENNQGQLLAKLDIVPFVKSKVLNPANAEEIVQLLTQDLLAEDLQPERYSYFLNNVLLDTLTTTSWAMEWNNYLQSNDDTAVRTQLEALVTAIVNSPEFQLM